MSGGPVLNERGEVIGLVSRSIAPNEGETAGVGWAACFSLMPWLPAWLPTVDPDNPTWRLGWAVRRPSPWSLHGFYENAAEARAEAQTIAEGYEVAFGSARIGTDSFVARSQSRPPFFGPVDYT
jgi:serine protease Do